MKREKGTFVPPEWGESIILSARLVERAARCCVYLLLAAVLAGVELQGAAPLGVALTAASGAGIPGGCAVAGACLGSLCRGELTAGMGYAAAALLTYAAAFALYDGRPVRRGWIMPLIAGAAVAFTGLAAHSRIPWTGREQVVFGMEILLTVGAARCFGWGLEGLSREGMTRRRRAGLVALSAGVLAALVPVEVGGLSAGRCLAGGMLLWGSRLGGAPTGAVWGSVLGTAVDLAGSGGPLRGMIWPLAGLCAGYAGGGRRLFTLLPWTAAMGACLIWAQDWETAALCAGEGAVAGLIFLLLPVGWLNRDPLGLGAPPAGAGETDPAGTDAVRARLAGMARAYASLCDILKESLRPPENDGDVSAVFDRAASRVCRSCADQSLCWQKEYSATFSALNDATAAMVERGRAQAGDFPHYFADRCRKMPAFLEAVNEELTALFYRRQYRARVLDNREAVCRQYDQLALLLERAAAELGEELVPDREKSRELARELARLGLEMEGTAWRDSRGLLRIRVRGKLSQKDGERLARGMGVPLRAERELSEGAALVEEEPFKAVAGVAARRRDGETVSGDAGTYFKRFDGKAYLLLCDGMGSGEAANRESTLAIRLLEQFLQTGIPADHALMTISSALALRGEDIGGFTTVDLLEIDLFTGAGELYKLGAAPTYVRQGEAIRRLSAGSLPAGLAGEGADRFSLHLAPGDCVVLVSDGVCGCGEDGWLLERLREFDGESPRRLAARLITQSPQGATDDRTALVVKLERR